MVKEVRIHIEGGGDSRDQKSSLRQGFKVSGIPKTPHVETIAKDDLERILKIATANTSKKEYHKINHASELLGKIDANKVRQASPYCNRIFTTIKAIMAVSNNNPN